jgi:hypothetical protein
MQANPDKFQVLAVGKKTFEKSPSIQIQNSNLSCETVVKLLGIDIDYLLNFVQKCHAKGQKLKLLKINVKNIVSLFNFDRKGPKRFNIFNC